MYKLVKRVVKLLLPKKWLIILEESFRAGISIFYRGKHHQCNICTTRLRTFISVLDEDLLCPRCGSLSRTRRLYDELVSNSELKGCVLHFSPARVLYKRFKTLKTISYIASDYENEFLADYKMDITDLKCENNRFDLIICLHILEHVTEDKKGMAELYRVLKPGGICYVQTPFKQGKIYEDETIVLPEEKVSAFGQSDHVRVYSVKGLEKRLNQSGFKTSIEVFKKNLYYGIKSETMIKATKV